MNRKHGIDVLIGLALTVACLVGIDIAVGAFAAEGAAEHANLSRGFSEDASYLHPDSEREGGWKTNFYPNENLERRIPPKDDRTRVIMFGGSNVNGFPGVALARSLNRSAGREQYEVINLGRSGYGSARVRIVFEQALEILEPDVVLIYCGHNEFVERGFQVDLEARGGDLSGPLAGLAAKTNMFRALASSFEEEEGGSPQTEPEAWKWEYSKFEDITFDETEQYFKSYEDNLRSMCEQALAKDVDVLLSTVIYNRLSVPFTSTYSAETPAEDREAFEELRRQALTSMPSYLAPLLPVEEAKRVHGHDWGKERSKQGDSPIAMAGWRNTSGLLARVDHRIMLQSEWNPVVVELDECLQRFYSRDLGRLTRAELEASELLLTQALEIIHDHPRALFELALLEYVLGRDATLFARHLEEAARFDRAPRKASTLVTDIILQVVAETPGVQMLDADATFQGWHPDRLVAWEWMIDHCHLQYGGRLVLMEIFAQAIENIRTSPVEQD